MTDTDPTDNTKVTPAPSLKGQMVTGTIWMVSMRWVIRFMGIISVSILARLLDKEDFGLVAMATAVSALPMVFLDLGLDMALIKERNATPALYNTAWTIRALQMTFIALLVLVSAPLAADFYADARIHEIFYALSVSIFLQGLENIWVVSFRKNFAFGKDFLYNSSAKLISVIVTIILAATLRSYWALVFGQIANTLVRSVISYFIVRERPRPTLSEWRTIWSFSQWTLLRGVAVYVTRTSDRLILGKLASAPVVGALTVSREIAALPSNEIAAPINRVIAPGFAELKHDPDRMAAALKKTLSAINGIAIPVSLGLAACAPQIVPVLLGDGWSSAIPLLQLLSITGVFVTPQNIMGTFQTVTGHISLSTTTVWLRAILMLAIGIPASMEWGAIGMAGAILAAGIVAYLYTLISTCRIIPEVTMGGTLATAVRPLLAAAMMLAAVLAWDYSGLTNVFVILALKLVTGGIVYVGTGLALWLVAGRPDGLENLLVEGFQKGLGHVKGLRARIFTRPSGAN